MMKMRVTLIAGLAALMMPAMAFAGVKVTFVAPERFQDGGLRGPSSREATLEEFRRMFVRLGDSYLKPGQTLSIQVLDLDLAGEIEPGRGSFYDLRVMRDVTPPRVKLRYVLQQGGRVILRGEETITNSSYLWNPSARISAGRLSHERNMLQDWFYARFVQMRPAPASF